MLRTLFLILFFTWVFLCLINPYVPRKTALRHNTKVFPFTTSSAFQDWIFALRRAFDFTTKVNLKSSLFTAIAGREAAITRLQGFVKIGDLVQQSELENHIVSLSLDVQDLDDNILYLQCAYESVLLHTTTLISSFCSNFGIVLLGTTRAIDRHKSIYMGSTHQDETAKDQEERQNLLNQFRQSKLCLLVTAQSIKNTITLLYEDIISEIRKTSPVENRFANNPLMLEHRASGLERRGHLQKRSRARLDVGDQTQLINTATEVLVRLGLPVSHSAHNLIATDLANISLLQSLNTHRVFRICEALSTILRILDDTARTTKQLRHDNIGDHIGKLIDFMVRLNDVVKRNYTQSYSRR